MSYDRISLALLGAIVLSGAAMTAEFSFPTSAVTVTTAAEKGAGEGEAGPAEEAVPEWTVATCEHYQDTDDPQKLAAQSDGGPVEILFDDQLSAQMNDDKDGVFDDRIGYCDAEAQKVTDPVQKARIAYGVARLELLYGRLPQAKARFGTIAQTYPAAAYRLAEMQIGEGNVLIQPPDSSEFGETMALLKGAADGGDKRAEPNLKVMLARYYPLERFEMPGMVAALMTGKGDSIPDTQDTRMALTSFFRGLNENCSKFGTLVISPEQQRAMDNYMVPIQVDVWRRMFEKLPEWTKGVETWTKDPSNFTINGVLRGWNTVQAAPAQVMFVMDQAANRDGFAAAEALTCRGPRTGKMLDNLYALFAKRANAEPEPASKDALEAFAKRPELRDI